MSEEKFRKAYAAEVKASAESKKRCNDLIEWTEQQRQTAIASHAGQLRNTLAFKADVDALVKVLEQIEYASRKDSLTEHERLQSVRTVVCAALSRHGHPVGPKRSPND